MKNYISFQGKGKWFQHLFKADEQFNKWHIQLYFTAESLDKFRELNLKTHLKKDDDGYYAKLSRPVSKLMKGKMIAFVPPVVLDKDGKPILDGTMIGNGSDITVDCEVYQYSAPGSKAKSNAIRLETVRIDNLIKYEPKRDNTEEQLQALERIEKTPQPVWN